MVPGLARLGRFDARDNSRLACSMAGVVCAPEFEIIHHEYYCGSGNIRMSRSARCLSLRAGLKRNSIPVGWSVNGRLVMIVLVAASLSGCYVYSAAPTTPVPGMHLALDQNDRGRVGLGDSIGAAVQTVEGTSVTTADSVYGLRVSKISYLNGQANNWSGELLVIPRMFVTNARQRKLSKSRSWLAGSAVAAAIAAFIASRDILGFGSSPKEDGPGKPGTQ